MTESRKKKGAGVNPAEGSGGSITTTMPTPTSPHLPIGDPFERILTTPKELLIQRASSPRRGTASPLKAKGTVEVCMEQLPKLTGVNPSLRDKLLESKIDQCSILCQFESVDLDGASAYSSTDALSNGSSARSPAVGRNFISPLELRNREIKRQAILELIEMINSGFKPIPDHLYPNFFQMILRNLFRPVPPPLNPTGDAYDPTEDEPVLEPSWPHLQLIYELFIRFLESPDMNGALARKFIDPPFVLQLLTLFDVEDPRERDLLKTTLHRIYAKFLQLRSFIRKSIHNVFYEFVADPTEYRHNISEMLEILGSIINGFALPLKEEHKIFLEKTLLPLHKTRYLSLYFRQLDYCVIQFIEKDPSLSVPVILGLLKIWPKTNSTKEVLFLTEIEEILEIISIEHFKMISEPLFRQISKCIDSNHFQVSERALLLWHNDFICENLIRLQVEPVLKIVLPILSKHAKSHWNRNVQLLIFNAIDRFMSIDSVLFDDCVAALPEIEQKSLERKRNLLACWKKLDEEVDTSGVDDTNARDQLYSLLKDSSDSNTGMDVKVDSILNNDSDIDDSTNPDYKIDNPPPVPPKRLISTRRKSILPVDSNVYHELANYSRSSSPRDEEEVEEKDREMRD